MISELYNTEIKHYLIKYLKNDCLHVISSFIM